MNMILKNRNNKKKKKLSVHNTQLKSVQLVYIKYNSRKWNCEYDEVKLRYHITDSVMNQVLKQKMNRLC